MGVVYTSVLAAAVVSEVKAVQEYGTVLPRGFAAVG